MMLRLVNNLKKAILLSVLATAAYGQDREGISRELVVSLLDRRLAVVENGEVVKIYTVAVGAAVSPSPEGEFQIVNRLEHPTYYQPGTVIAPGPQNPLGTRWMGLSRKGFGIHGTNVPESIGKASSHGCIRMDTSDLEELFARVRVGDRVVIRGERDEQVTKIFGSSPVVVAASSHEPVPSTSTQP